MSWTAGIEALLKSKLVQFVYSGLSHKEQNMFIWEAYCLPYVDLEDEDTITAEKETATMNPQETPTAPTQGNAKL